MKNISLNRSHCNFSFDMLHENIVNFNFDIFSCVCACAYACACWFAKII